jgi:hypothetical protein
LLLLLPILWEDPIMAVGFIGGSILFAVIEVLGEKLTTPEILGFFKIHKLNDGLLGKLKETLNTLNGLLGDGLLGKLKETHITFNSKGVNSNQFKIILFYFIYFKNN